MTKQDKIQHRFHFLNFTIKTVIIIYFVFIGIQLIFLYTYGDMGIFTSEANGFYGHHYCGTFFIDITRDNSFVDTESYSEHMDLEELFSIEDAILFSLLSFSIIFLMIFMNRADKQMLLNKRSAWLITLSALIYVAGSIYTEISNLYPDTSDFKGVMATQSYYPQIIYSVFGITAVMFSYGAILFHYEQLSREKSTALSRFNLKAFSFVIVSVLALFMLWRLAERIYEIINAVSGGDHNARLPFYSVFLDLPVSDAISKDAYVKVLIFRMVKDLPVFVSAIISVILLAKIMYAVADGEINTKRNRRRLKTAAILLAISSIIFNLLGVVEVDMLRESFTGIYSTATYTIGVRAGCEPMLFSLLFIAFETYIQAIPSTEEAETAQETDDKKVQQPKSKKGSVFLGMNTALKGTKEEKALQCLKKAGWHKGRKVDISEVEEWYAQWNITLSEPVKAIFSEYYGLAEEWWFNSEADGTETASDFELFLFPSTSGENYLNDIDNKGKFADQEMAETVAGEQLVFIGYAGYNYPDFLFASRNGVIWTTNGQKYDDMFSVVLHHFSRHSGEWSSVRMKQYGEWK